MENGKYNSAGYLQSSLYLTNVFYRMGKNAQNPDNYSFKKAIACYSWAIASKKILYSVKTTECLNERGKEYLKNNYFIQAIEDFNRSIRINPTENREAYHEWLSAYFGHYSDVFPNGTHINLKRNFSKYKKNIYSIYRKEYKLPQDWPYKTETTEDFRYVFEDIWLAVNAGGYQKAIDYANAGLIKAVKNEWEESLKYFNLAIDSDQLFSRVIYLCKEDYKLAKDEFKSILKSDIKAASNSKNRFKLSIGIYMGNFPFKYKNEIIDIQNAEETENEDEDEFYLILKNFLETNSAQSLDNKHFYGIFSDYLNGNHREDAALLKELMDLEMHKHLLKTSRKDKKQIRRMLEIAYYLLALRRSVI